MTNRSFFVLAYDIASNRRRVKIARLMESMGARVQGSVFEAWLTSEELKKLVQRSKKVLVLDEDSLRIYPICQACQVKIQMVGCGQATAAPGVVIV